MCNVRKSVVRRTAIVAGPVVAAVLAVCLFGTDASASGQNWTRTQSQTSKTEVIAVQPVGVKGVGIYAPDGSIFAPVVGDVSPVQYGINW